MTPSDRSEDVAMTRAMERVVEAANRIPNTVDAVYEIEHPLGFVLDVHELHAAAAAYLVLVKAFAERVRS